MLYIVLFVICKHLLKKNEKKIMKERIIYILELVVARVATTCFVTRSIKIIHSQSCEGLKIVAQSGTM